MSLQQVLLRRTGWPVVRGGWEERVRADPGAGFRVGVGAVGWRTGKGRGVGRDSLGGYPSPLLNHLKRLVAFHNPEFYKKQKMRLSTALTPRVMACAEKLPLFVALPLGPVRYKVDAKEPGAQIGGGIEMVGGFKKQEVRVTVEWTCPLLRGPS